MYAIGRRPRTKCARDNVTATWKFALNFMFGEKEDETRGICSRDENQQRRQCQILIHTYI